MNSVVREQPARIFWAFSEPFLTTAPDTIKQRGRIPRQVLSLVWKWLATDILPKHLPALEAAVIEAIKQDSITDIVGGIVRMKRLVGPVLNQTLLTCAGQPKIIEKLDAYIGSPFIMEHLRDINDALAIEPLLGQIQSAVPGRLRETDLDSLPIIRRAVLEACSKEPEKTDMIVVGAMANFAEPIHALRLAREDFGIPHASDVEAGEFGIIADVIGYDLQTMADETIHQIELLGFVPSNVERLMMFGTNSKQVGRELDTANPSKIGALLETCRQSIQGAVAPRFEGLSQEAEDFFAPIHQNRLEAAPNSENYLKIRFPIMAAKQLSSIASELGISESVQVMNTDVAEVIERASTVLIEAIRDNGGETRERALEYLYLIVELTEILHGARTARIVRRLGEAAATAPDPLQKQTAAA